MSSIPFSPIQVLYNRNGTISLIWLKDTTGLVKLYNVYWNSRKSGTFTFYKSVVSAVHYSHAWVKIDIPRSELAGIEDGSTLFFTVTEVDWQGTETPFADSYKKIVYPDGIVLANSPSITDVDYQESGAVDVDFTTSDRFWGILEFINLSRDVSTSIDILVTTYPDPEYIIDFTENFTGKVYALELNQGFHQLDGKGFRVQTTGVAGGQLSILIGRKKLMVPVYGW